jgi:hypothetical protein
MTIEQELQTAIQSGFVAMAEEAEAVVAIVADKIHDGTEGAPQDEEYPCIAIITSTPVPQGHQSTILEVPLIIRAMSYLPDARTKQEYAELAELVYTTLQDIDDWSIYAPNGPSPRVRIDGVMIDSSEEPVIEGPGLIVQTTNCTIHACDTGG